MWVSVVERALSGYGFPKRRHAKVQKSSNYLDVAVATGDAQRTSFSGSYTVTGYMRQQETNDLEPPAPARRVKRCNIRLSGRFTVPLSTIGSAGEEPTERLPPGVVPKALRGKAPRQLQAMHVQEMAVLGEHDMECTSAGTYASTVCKYCIDVPKKVCESICDSGLDQTPSSCNWSPWWAWSGVAGGGEGWCCGGY